jgi:hypothetical protein
MTTAAPEKDTKAIRPALLVPPDERFWQRYSRHGEAPLSFAGSVALHALAVGGLVLFALYLASLFSGSTGSLPIEPVRLDGGSGGKPTGAGDHKGIGLGAEDLGEPATEPQPGAEDAPRRPSLAPAEVKKLREEFDPRDIRPIQESDTGRKLARMQEAARRKLFDGLQPGKGVGGPGAAGPKGKGPGPGKGTLSKRARRMLRWHMHFTANTGSEYLMQLRGLGAILAFPAERSSDTRYKVARDLRPGGPMRDEDVAKIQRIFWIDDKPQSVRDVLGALRATLNPVPSRFVAFMPEELEKRLFEMERRYVEKVLRRKFDEDRIDETLFRVVGTPRGYRPELISVHVK